MRYMSKSARKVVKCLNRFGVDVEGTVYFQIEVACSMFYHTHIIGVIESVLKSGGVAQKLFKAQEFGWYYFAQPITDMLKSRNSAQNINFPGIDETFVVERSAKVYGIVCTTLLAHDINSQEINQLLYDVPPLCNKNSLMESIRICKDRGARSIPYLHGILERRGADLRARLKERDDDTKDVWIPGEVGDTIAPDEAATNWASLGHAIQSMKDMNATPSRHRRGS